jgi:hypothetical protein
MQLINRAIATCNFELRRAISAQRIAVSSVLILFPPVMLSLMISVVKVSNGVFEGTEVLIIFLISLICILSLLLWATPNVYSELEGKSWMFIASRPQGRIANVIGKFLASLIFAYAICLTSITICVLIASVFLPFVSDPVRMWLGLNGVFFLGCVCYSAIFSLIGTIFYRRAMVIGAAYVIGFEAVIGRIPAVIGKLTASYHLQNIGIEWIGSEQLKQNINEVGFLGEIGEFSTWLHLIAVAVITIIALGAACFVIVNREYVTSDET